MQLLSCLVNDSQLSAYVCTSTPTECGLFEGGRDILLFQHIDNNLHVLVVK